jgi:CRP-like cAMP-binding protein
MNIYVRKQSHDLCKYLDDSQVTELSKLSALRNIPAGEVIQRRGAAVDSLIMLEEGELVIMKEDLVVGRIFEGEMVNELHYFTNCPAPLTLLAEKTSRLSLITFHAIDAFIANDADRCARIQAAFNDSLSLKIIHLTYLEAP